MTAPQQRLAVADARHARWRLHGLPPLGGSLALPGVDLVTVENGKIVAVERHFDRQTMAEQLGFQVIVQPGSDGIWQLGYSWRATAGSTAEPGAISLTWTDVRSREEAEQLEAIGGLFGAELTQARRPSAAQLVFSVVPDQPAPLQTGTETRRKSSRNQLHRQQSRSPGTPNRQQPRLRAGCDLLRLEVQYLVDIWSFAGIIGRDILARAVGRKRAGVSAWRCPLV
jgi:hypothetical protein